MPRVGSPCVRTWRPADLATLKFTNKARLHLVFSFKRRRHLNSPHYREKHHESKTSVSIYLASKLGRSLCATFVSLKIYYFVMKSRDNRGMEERSNFQRIAAATWRNASINRFISFFDHFLPSSWKIVRGRCFEKLSG